MNQEQLSNLENLKGIIEDMLSEDVSEDALAKFFNSDGTASCIKGRYLLSLLDKEKIKVVRVPSWTTEEQWLPLSEEDREMLVKMDEDEHFGVSFVEMFDGVFNGSNQITLQTRLQNVNDMISR